MKFHSLFFLLSMALGTPALVAQLPIVTTHNVMLDVVNKAAGGGVKEGTGAGGGGYNYGSSSSSTTVYKETKNHESTLEITVRSQDKTPVQVQVEWYFFAKDLVNYHVKKEYLLDSGTKTVSLQPSDSSTFDVTSKDVQTSTSRSVTVTTSNDSLGNTTTSYGGGTQTQAGTKISGWVVRILVDGKILDAKGSDYKYENPAMDPDQFEALKAGKF